ncbi:TonB-dependent hemoglobin/transferrin/lactoferrin family receptor [Pectobacterium cacticida]|uniref:TonB-dependent hemoglobin/transferrin/lactoferrin family receptor n=1 Tax=Pectobacterium cacticida TaxID=69221 RepID=A0ABZ2GAG9_9GAMM|nr:TonB-dependent receptor [Pectobacterium cacticida]UYX06774.1 TonB-dependent hemoglobin/transferrin/lactoferrin family receptor [Pectobacterium cacticida]
MTINTHESVHKPVLTAARAVHWALSVGLSLGTVGMTSAAEMASAASAPTIPFAIPAGPLGNTLQAIASRANVILTFSPDQTQNKTSANVQGTYTVQGAFAAALAGTGLSAIPTATGYRLEATLVAEGNDGSLTIPTLSVVGGTSDSAAAGRSVLRQRDIDRVQADNIAGLLDKLPGVAMAGSPRPGGQSLNIWGMGDMEDVNVVLDGAPKGFEKYRQGSVFIEPELIKRIDVDKGPHDIRSGNGGFGGTIQVETKDASDLLLPGENFGGMAKYSYHTNDRQNVYSGALYGRTEGGMADGLLYMSKRDGDNIERPDGTRFAYSTSDMASYLLKTNVYLTDEQMLTLSAMRSESNGWQPFAAKRDDMTAPSQSDVDRYGWEEAWRRKLVYRDQVDKNYSLKWNIAPQDQPWLNLTASFATSKTEQHDRRSDLASQSSYLGTLGNESWISYKDRLAEISNESQFTTGPLDHKLLVGMRWHQHKRNTLMYYPRERTNAEYHYGYFQPYYMPSGDQETRSFYVQDAMTLGSVTITPGVRYDHVTNSAQPNIAPRYNSSNPAAGHDYRSVTYTGWSPRIGALWKATENLSLFADVSRTWRAPVVDEQYEVQSATSSVPGTSRDLQVESIKGVRLGAILDFNQLMLEDDSLQIRTTLFRNRGKNEIFKRTGVYCKASSQTGSNSSCAGPLSVYRNLPGYTIEGVEIESFYDSRWLFGSLSFSSMRGERDASPRDPWGNKTWLADIPPTTAHATLGTKIPRLDMAVGWTGDFVRKQDRSPTDGDPKASGWALPKTKGYVLHGLFASWQPQSIKGFEARVTVDNLLNTDYHPYLGESVSGVGRNVKISVLQRF